MNPTESLRRPRRWTLIAVAMIGAALVVLPFAFNMFTKTPQGAQMIAQFKPFMTVGQLDGYQNDMKQINAGVQQTDTSVATYLGHGRVDRTAFATSYPSFVSFDQQWPAIDSKMSSLMNQVQENLGNYQAVAALPSFTLFPWFFVAPGLVVLGFAVGSLLRPQRWRRGRWVVVVLGVGLIAAPGVFQMFQRAPKGGQMMTAFKTIETTPNVEQIQGYFGSMAVGQGAIRLEIVPALRATGLTTSQIRTEFPAVATLDSQWIHILNTMTPMIGAMSDNVERYQALASLPPFPLFPWFFVLPGVLVAGLSLATGVTRKREELAGKADAPPFSIPTYQGVS